ncbi:chaperonin 10-like protein [Bombardia bombarda]|uniref:Chaperonin 10-like protein n=1 Tax=Bombardia bombarda TaxID=252184 RepID=A0AA40C9K1_9PEZI|nr:chaperonin 10-like protein [Bombardia bombarda]
MASSLPKTYKAAVFPRAGAPLEIWDVPLKQPGRGQVLVKVLACGVCHTDAFIQSGGFHSPWPLVPGHEIVGDVVAVGEGVRRFKEGDRVGGGFHGGHDGICRSCQRGMFQQCANGAITGGSTDGGYAEYTLLREEATSFIPPDMDPAEAAPFLCAGTTVFNAIRKLRVEQGNLVAIQGLGGLGHLAVQYARKMGYTTVAISRGGADKRRFAVELGAHEYIDTTNEDVAGRLGEMGGAALIVSTGPDGKAASELVGGLQNGGKLVILAPMGPVGFDTTALITKGASVHGWSTGNALDGEEALEFAKRHGVRCLIETFPLADAVKAFDIMLQGTPRFRNVLVMN